VSIATEAKPLIWLISHGDAARDANLLLLQELRKNGFAADMDPTGRSIKSQFKLADREKAAYCLITGESELSSNTVVLKDMKTQEQTTVPRNAISQTIHAKFS
jgi:histidyl-tRNA synthetase